MRKAAVALLVGAYILIALTLAALAWRGGAAPGVGAAVFMGTLGLALAIHGMIGRALDAASFSSELATLRQAHRILADHVEATQGALESLEETVQTESTQKTDALVSEVRMLEDLVARMGDGLEARLARAMETRPAPAQDSRRASLLQVVREALTENRVDLYLQPVVTLP